MSINYYKELSKRFHPDTNKGDRACVIIFKVINKLNQENKQRELRNLYNRLYTGYRSK